MKKKKKSKFISLVRDPVSRNVSSFFENFVEEKNWNETTSSNKIVHSFLEEYSHETPLTWFEREPHKMLGIDIYKTPFPHEKGCLTLKNGPFEMLVPRVELSDFEKAEAVQSFLGMRSFEIQRANVGTEKSYADLYRKFKQEVSLPERYIKNMLESKYARHFYTQEERVQVFDRWS